MSIMWYNRYAQTHVEIVKNGTISRNLRVSICFPPVCTWFAKILQHVREADVVNLLLWGSHNYSACILSHNKFIAV